MTNEEKIQAEFEALMNESKAEAKAVVEQAAKNAKETPRVERKKPTLHKYFVEDVTPEGYGI